MRKCLFLMLGLMVTACAQAITIYWTTSGSDWTSALGSSTISSVDFVYSQTELTTGAAFYSAISSTSTTGKTTVNATSTGGASGNDYSYNYSSSKSYRATFSATSLTASAATNTGYFYLVLSVKSSTTGEVTYYTSKGIQFTGSTNSSTTGIYDDTVNPDTFASAAGAYVEVSYGGSHAAPEPTTLALLALGVAGLALRRRVK